MSTFPSVLLQVNPVFASIGVITLIVAIGGIYSSIRIVDEHEKHALTVFGEYRKLLNPGVNFVPPFISSTYPFNMQTQTIDIPAQETLADDNLWLTASGTVSLRVINAEKAFNQVEDHEQGVSSLSQTTLRAVLSEMETDAIHNRSAVSDRVRRYLSEPTDEWGIRIESVEIQDIQRMYE